MAERHGLFAGSQPFPFATTHCRADRADQGVQEQSLLGLDEVTGGVDERSSLASLPRLQIFDTGQFFDGRAIVAQIDAEPSALP